jgi:hypothetical protein
MHACRRPRPIKTALVGMNFIVQVLMPVANIVRRRRRHTSKPGVAQRTPGTRCRLRQPWRGCTRPPGHTFVVEPLATPSQAPPGTEHSRSSASSRACRSGASGKCGPRQSLGPSEISCAKTAAGTRPPASDGLISSRSLSLDLVMRIPPSYLRFIGGRFERMAMTA